MELYNSFMFCMVASVVLMFVSPVLAASSCYFRCQEMPSLFHYMYPSTGCHCHSTCGGQVPCCSDKVELCDNVHACTKPKDVRQATADEEDKLFYGKGETITYECEYHYEISGSATRTCWQKNIWTPGPPTCKYVRYVCRPPRISDGDYTVKKKQYVYGDSIDITCNPGYVMEGSSTLTCGINRWNEWTPSCIKDRCATTHCAKDATCMNLRYYSKCYCNAGFTGHGWRCHPLPCYQHTCTSNEQCVDRGDGTGDYDCECKDGYIRFGGSCALDPCAINTCNEQATCSVVDGMGVCTCNEGYIGDETTCEVDPCVTNTCHLQATCSVVNGMGVCTCNEGYLGDGTTCKVDPCHENNCHENAACTVVVDLENFACDCNEGFKGNGTHCEVDPCTNTCHLQATCSVVNGMGVCTCNEGYLGDGTTCKADPCYENNCHENAICTVTVDTENFACDCNEGFKGNGTHCEAAKCNTRTIYGEEESIVGMCNECEDECCDATKLRECRICIHMKCNGGEVCDEGRLSRVPTVCTDKKCYENGGGFTVDTPSNVHCLDAKGLQMSDMSCCWIGE